MFAFGQICELVFYRAVGVFANVGCVVRVEHGFLLWVVVEFEQNVVPDTAANGVDAAVVRNVRHKQRRFVGLVARFEHWCVQIHVYLRSLIVGDGVRVFTADGELFVVTICLIVVYGIDGVVHDASQTVVVADVFRYDKVGCKLSVGNDYRTYK